MKNFDLTLKILHFQERSITWIKIGNNYSLFIILESIIYVLDHGHQFIS